MPAMNGFIPWVLAGATLLTVGGGGTAYIHSTFATKEDIKAIEENQRRINQKLDFMIWFPYFPAPPANREDWPALPLEPDQQPKEEEESLSADSDSRSRMHEPEVEPGDSSLGGY